MAMGLVMVSCSNDDAVYSIDEAAKQNAEKVLGFSIPEGQDWKMVAKAKASISVNGNYGEKYTVKIYENNPFIDNKGVVLAQGTVASGSTFTAEFNYPAGDSTLYAALVDAKGYSQVKPVAVSNNMMTTSFGKAVAKKAPRKASTTAEIPNVTVTKAQAEAYLTGATEVNDANAVANWNGDPNYVTKMKITGTWNKGITVLASEAPAARTIYVTGTWTIPAGTEQRAGGGSVIVVAEGGKIIISEGASLTGVNASRIWVMRGGEISGKGKLVFPNGSEFSYNAGNINVGALNNNGGNVYNYGTLTANELMGSASKSTFINHSKMTIDHSQTGSGSSNTRILNACWFEATNNLSLRNIVLGASSYLHAASLVMSASQDGTNDASDIVLGDNALLDVTGEVYLNNTSIEGPTGDNYGFVQFGKMKQMQQTGGYDTQMTAGYVANNVYVSVDVKDVDNNPWLFTPYESLVAGLNGKGTHGVPPTVGNGNAVMIQKGQADVAFAASECTPGYNPAKVTPVVEEKLTYNYAFEDTPLGDYDLNDVVLLVKENKDDASKIDVTLAALGATLDINIYLGDKPLFDGKEAHEVMGVAKGTMINTGRNAAARKTITISKPAGFDITAADFNIRTTKGTVRLATAGQDPHAVVIPGNWSWPKEGINVKQAFSTFAQFALDASHKTATNWYQNAVEDKVMKFEK